MRLELARQAGVTMFSRAKGLHFLVLNRAEKMIFDAPPDGGVGSSPAESGDEP